MKDWINNNICTHIVCCADITRDEDDCPGHSETNRRRWS